MFCKSKRRVQAMKNQESQSKKRALIGNHMILFRGEEREFGRTMTKDKHRYLKNHATIQKTNRQIPPSPLSFFSMNQNNGCYNEKKRVEIKKMHTSQMPTRNDFADSIFSFENKEIQVGQRGSGSILRVYPITAHQRERFFLAEHLAYQPFLTKFFNADIRSFYFRLTEKVFRWKTMFYLMSNQKRFAMHI